MPNDVVIKPMTEEFILWRCLHQGPLDAATIEKGNRAARRDVNLALLTKLIRTYGTCAMLAWDRDQVVGYLRFYPKAIASFTEAGFMLGMCLQQPPPAGPSESVLERRFPPLAEIEDKTLRVHCLMTGSPFVSKNTYQRKGIGTRMARALMEWAAANGWTAVEAMAFEDINFLYSHTGQAGLAFWAKLGFTVVRKGIEPFLAQENDFSRKLRAAAQAEGFDLAGIANVYTMRFELAVRGAHAS